MKKIAILGSTGSIGTQTLDVVRNNGDIEVLGLAAGSTIELLEEQTEAICLEAVKQKGELLAYVQNQNLQICLEAVKQNPDALRYVKELYRDAVLRQLKQAA